MTDMEFESLLEKLCLADGISGDEDEVRDIISGIIAGKCDTLKTDKQGSLIALVRGTADDASVNAVMVDAHMDEVGFMVKAITEEGYLLFGNVGGIDARILSGKRVRIGKNKLQGVISFKALHLQSDSEEEEAKKDDYYIDIGASGREDAAAHVEQGDPVYFDSGFERFGDGFIVSKAIDDRLGCAILVDAIDALSENRPRNDVYFSFSMGEEIGLCGARAAAYAIAPKTAIVLEATTAADIADADDALTVCRAGDGAVLSFADGTTVYDADNLKRVVETAEKSGVKYQLKRRISGGNDAGSIHRSRAGVTVTSVSAPCRYIHSPASVMKLSDAHEMRKLLKALLV